MDVSDTTIAGNATVGVGLMDGGTRVTLTNVTIVDQVPTANGAGGAGVDVEAGAELVATETTIERNHGFGIEVAGDGSSATLSNVAIADTLAPDDGPGGVGLGVYLGASVDAAGLRVTGSAAEGIQVTASTASLREIVVSGTRSDMQWSDGIGLDVAAGAIVDVDN